MSRSGFEVKMETNQPINHLSLDEGSSRSQMDSQELRSLFPEIIGESPGMMQVFEHVHKISKSQSAVLILGESGTGKELIASAIHRLSYRADKRFLAINCSAIPENLLESELFGYEKGAFTNASSRRLGLFEIADGGTIFLDEIGDMPANLQAKLLRVLQEKKFIPLGGNVEKSADVRIIAATNVDLQDYVLQKKFRADLYYRLNVLPVNLPPLRERQQDVSLLLRHFLRLANRMHGLSQPCSIDEDAMRQLVKYSWPGNVRQLQNLVERLVVLRRSGKISLCDIPQEYRLNESKAFEFKATDPKPLDPPASKVAQSRLLFDEIPSEDSELTSAALCGSIDAEANLLVTDLAGVDLHSLFTEGFCLSEYIERLENSLILRALDLSNNNRNRAAKLLGMNRTTLVERIKKRSLAQSKSAS